MHRQAICKTTLNVLFDGEPNITTKVIPLAYKCVLLKKFVNKYE